MAWRVARSLERLITALERLAPGTRVGTIGDENHEPPSRHLPGPQDRVRAIDVHGNAGLDLDWLVEQITTNPHPAVTYVIHKDRAWSPEQGWHDYHGAYHEHVHIAVSDEAADNPSPWGLGEEDSMSIIGLAKGDGLGDDNDPNVLALRERVTSLQGRCKAAGQGKALGKAGIDGIYGDLTAEALRLARASVGSDAEEGWGNEVSGWADFQLMEAVIEEKARRRAAGETELPDEAQATIVFGD